MNAETSATAWEKNLHPEFVLNPQGDAIFLHAHTKEEVPDADGNIAIKKTGSYWAYCQTPEALMRLVIQKHVNGPLPPMTQEAERFLMLFAEDNRKQIEEIVSQDGAALTIEQIISVCRGQMPPHPLPLRTIPQAAAG